MISNERPSFSGQYGHSFRPPKIAVEERTLSTKTLQVERKTFIVTLKENSRGRFLRITEDVNGQRDNLIIPSTGLDEFRTVLDQMVRASLELSGAESNKVKSNVPDGANPINP
jgi:hypothetical protein